MIRTINEILEKSEEKRKWQEFDAFCLNLLPVPPEPLTPEEAEEQQKEWDEMVAAAKAKSTSKPNEIYIPPDQFKCEYMPPHQLFVLIQSSAKKPWWGRSPEAK